jgi:hypothetical protein
LLVEEQRTNLITYSEQFDNAAWSKGNATITANAVAAPDGTLTADKIVENTANGDHNAASSVFTATAGATYTTSVFVKAAERNFAWIRLFQNTSPFAYVGYTINLTTGATSSTSVTFPSTVWTNSAVSAQSVGNGWWRISVTGTIASADNIRLIVGPATSATTVSYVGDGTSGIYAWGAQLEAGAFPTSYIPTVASQATRAADSASMTGTNFSSWYNATEGTLYAEFGPYANAGVSGNTGIAQIYGATSSDTIRLFGGATTVPVFQVSVGGVAQAYLNVGTLIPANTTKLVGAYKADDFAKSLNGGAIDSDTSGTVPTVNQMLIGSGTGGITSLNGTIARIAFYPRRLNNAELQGITA